MRGLAVAAMLLLGALATTASAQTSSPQAGELEIKDQEGDVGARSGPAPVGAPLYPNLDILALRVHSEDHEGLWLELRVKDLKLPAQATAENRYAVQFRLESPAMQYRLNFYPLNQFNNNTPDYHPSFCAGPAPGGCEPQRVSGRADYTNNALVTYIPKTSLMGRNSAYEDYQGVDMPPVSLSVGSQLVHFVAESASGFMTDRVPNSGTGGPYVTKAISANDRLRVALPKANETEADHDFDRSEGAFPHVAVDANVPTSVKIEIQNLNGGKRVANVSASLADPKATSHWSVRIASSVNVPGNESRTLNLVITAKPGVQHREQTLVRVLARSIGFADELGALTLNVVASVPPSLANPTLYLHGHMPNDSTRGTPICTVRTPGSWFCYEQLWLNTLETDPLSKGEAKGYSGIFGYQESTVSYSFVLDAPLANDLTLSQKLAVEALLRVNAPAGGEGTVTARLSGGDVNVGSASAPFKAGATEPVAISFLPLIDAGRIPSGERLRLDVTLSTPWSSPTGMANPPYLTLKDSKVTLPIIADPNASADLPTANGDAFITLSVKGEREEFVNPGEARAFQLTIVNEGTKTDTVTLASTIDGDGCRAEFRPGTSYRLEEGDSARFGVLVFAPSGAKEGAQCKVRINATSRVDPASVAVRDVIVTITRGVDVPDDSENYTSNADAESKLDKPPASKKSPGLGFGLVAVVVIGIIWRRSRSKV